MSNMCGRCSEAIDLHFSYCISCGLWVGTPCIDCGKSNPQIYGSCIYCGDTIGWKCKCDEINSLQYEFCLYCGVPRRKNEEKITLKETYHSYLCKTTNQLDAISSSIQKVIPSYMITHKIASGGFATVYRATDPSGNAVALKCPKFIEKTIDSSLLDRFKGEAEIWKKLKHKNIVQFYNAETLPMVYISIELMEGGDLKRLLEKYTLSIDEAVDIMLQVLDGMSYAHRMATIHRDIKPENILFTSEGIAKISDWGIGKFMATESATKTTSTKGTLLYSAPEQISKKKFGVVDWTTDVFQLGILFFEMLTGKNPFFDEDSAGIMGNFMYEEPEPPSVYNKEVTPELDHIVMRALEKKREDRWRSADVMYDRLRELVDG